MMLNGFIATEIKAKVKTYVFSEYILPKCLFHCNVINLVHAHVVLLV